MAETVRIDEVFAKRETEKALLCEIEGEDHWVPKSQIHDDSEVFEEGHKGTLVVTAWYARKNGLS